MPSTIPKDVNALAENLVEQARTEAELRLIQIDVEEARVAGKTDRVVGELDVLHAAWMDVAMRREGSS